MTSTDTPLPDPAVTDNNPQPPTLTLFELMRKDVDNAPTDASSSILSNPRPSIWDLQ